MPEEVTQRLGFDASRAIEELRKLQNQLNQFKQGLQSTSGALRKFPSKAQPAIRAFRELSNAANQAKIAVQGLGQAGAIPKTVPSSVQNAANSMNNLSQQAQAAGQKVQTTVVQSFNQGAQSAKNLGKATQAAAKATQQATKTVSTGAGQAAAALDEAGKAGKKAGQLITISWKTVIRVIQAQIIVRALSKLVSMFGEAHQAAMELSLAIGEIATISTGALGSLEDISQAVLEFSSNLGIAAEEVAEGLYQTLSNQVVEAGDALRFEESAAKLSIATHSQLKESVNALSSVMNSYGLNVSEVDHVSDVLFKTIELGRLRMGEFGDVLGRVTPLTAALGIRFEEMSAALAALTQKGVPAHTAITQLTQVSQKLMRPTQKLQELYREWGVETGPEAIRRFGGLAGVLLKMKDATAGNDKEFADLLGRVRAMVGALNLTSQEGNALTDALKAMDEAAGAAEKAFKKMQETAGYKAKKAWIDLTNEVIKFGHKLLEIGVPIAKTLKFLFENLNYIAAAMVGAGGAALVMSGKFTIAAVTLTGLTGAVKAFAMSIWALMPILILVAAAMATVFIAKEIQKSLRGNQQLFDEHKKQLEDLVKVHEETSNRRIEKTRKEFEERRKITGEGFSALTKEYGKVMDVIEASSKVIERTLTETLSNLIEQRKKGIQELKKATLEIDSAIKDSMKEITSTQEAIAEDAFKREKRYMSARSQLWAEINRAQETAARAREAYIQAGANEEKVRAARELSHLAEKRAKEAVTHAEEMGNRGDLRKAEKELDKIRSNRIAAEIKFQIERGKYQDDAHKKEIQRLEEAGKEVEELYKKLVKLADPMISEGVLKSIEQRRADAERIAELAPEIERALDEAFDFSMFERLGGMEAMNKIKAGFQDAFSKAQFDWTNLLIELEQAITSKVYSVSVRIEIENEYILEEFVKRFGELDILGDPGKFGSQMEQVLEGIIEKYENLQDMRDTRTVEGIKKIQQAIDAISLEEFYSAWDKPTNAVKKFRQYIEDLGKSTLEAGKSGKALTAEQLKAFQLIVNLGRELEKVGKLSTKNIDQSTYAVKQLQEGMTDLQAATKAENDQIKMGEGTYEDSLTALMKHREEQKKANEAQKKITEEAGKTTNQLESAKQKQVEMPAVAAQAKEALAQETDQARQLKAELQGATQAQRELSQVQKGAPGAVAGPEQPVPPEKTKEELEAQAEAARQLTNELITVDNQFNTVLQSIDNVTQTMTGTSEIAAQIAHSMEFTVLAVGDLQSGLEFVNQSINAGILAIENLNISIINTTLSINTAAQAVGNWTIQLNNCATAGYSVAAAMRSAAAAAMAAASACAKATAACSGGVAAAYYGGPAVHYRQEGGFSPRGQDRIPIMAAPGEFIVSARNARRFASELQAMNAGNEPSYRDRGGPVTNVGDINVSVTQGESVRQTAREIATALRRELRRGTSRLS